MICPSSNRRSLNWSVFPFEAIILFFDGMAIKMVLFDHREALFDRCSWI